MKTGTTFTALSIDEKEPDGTGKLNKYASCLEISFFRRITILLQHGPLALLMWREDMTIDTAIFSLYVDWINIELLH